MPLVGSKVPGVAGQLCLFTNCCCAKYFRVVLSDTHSVPTTRLESRFGRTPPTLHVVA